MRPTSGRALGIIVCVVALALTSACSWTENDTRSATAGLPDVTVALQSERWILDPAASTLGDIGPRELSLVFEPSHLEGAACYAYRASYVVDDHTLEVRDLSASDEGATCEAATLAARSTYLDALAGTHTVDVTDRDRLVLTDGDTRLEFVPDPNRVYLAGE